MKTKIALIDKVFRGMRMGLEETCVSYHPTLPMHIEEMIEEGLPLPKGDWSHGHFEVSIPNLHNARDRSLFFPATISVKGLVADVLADIRAHSEGALFRHDVWTFYHYPNGLSQHIDKFPSLVRPYLARSCEIKDEKAKASWLSSMNKHCAKGLEGSRHPEASMWLDWLKGHDPECVPNMYHNGTQWAVTGHNRPTRGMAQK